MKNLRSRVVNNWVTSVAGLVLAVGMGFMLYVGKITFDNFCFILPTILLLLGVKDSLVGINREK